MLRPLARTTLRRQLGSALVRKDLRKKYAEMAKGPFPFLHATYYLWAEEILNVCPELAGAPPVVAVGDIHLENFGTWRDNDGRLIWGVNDFDEAAEMPYALDLVRLGVSAVLGCPHIRSTRAISDSILRGYERADRRGAVKHDFDARDPDWLHSAIERAAKFIRDEHGEWRKSRR